MKIYLAIDRELIRESYRVNGQFAGLRGQQLQRADEVLTEFMQLDYTDETIDAIANIDLDNLEEGLGNIFKKIGRGIKKVAKAVVQVVKPVAKAVVGVVKAVGNVVKAVVTTPVRAVAVVGLETLKGPVAKSFTYVFIPDNAPELEKNPKVKTKRKKQIEALDKIIKHVMLDREYVMKHIRNSITTHYKKNPEEILHDLSTGKEKEFAFTPDQLEDNSLGVVDPATVIAAGASLVTAIGGLAALFKKQNLPTTYDWQQQISGSRNVTNDPGFTPLTPWYKKPAGIVGIVLGATALAGGTYYALQD